MWLIPEKWKWILKALLLKLFHDYIHIKSNTNIWHIGTSRMPSVTGPTLLGWSLKTYLIISLKEMRYSRLWDTMYYQFLIIEQAKLTKWYHLLNHFTIYFLKLTPFNCTLDRIFNFTLNVTHIISQCFKF